MQEPAPENALPYRTPPANGAWSTARLSCNMIADYKPFVFVDGPGVRCSLYVSECPFTCTGCFNRAAQSFRYGTAYTADLENRILEDLSESYVAGLTLLGGEPFLNTGVLLPLVQRVRKELPGKTVWAWSGYTWEQLRQRNLTHPDQHELLELIDVLVDGPFIQDQLNLNLAFRGSANQRIIDVPASLAAERKGLPAPVVLTFD